MKHFVVGIITPNHIFECGCSTISEAYDAVKEAKDIFSLDVNLDDIMMNLTDINTGKIISVKRQNITIWVEREDE